VTLICPILPGAAFPTWHVIAHLGLTATIVVAGAILLTRGVLAYRRAGIQIAIASEAADVPSGAVAARTARADRPAPRDRDATGRSGGPDSVPVTANAIAVAATGVVTPPARPAP
jgi:hypothetical protein